MIHKNVRNMIGALATAFAAVAGSAHGVCGYDWLGGYERNGTSFAGTIWDSVVFDDGHGLALWACSDAGRVYRYDGSSWREFGKVFGNNTGLAGGFTYNLEVCDPDGAGPMGPALFVSGAFRRIQSPDNSIVIAGGVARWTGSNWVNDAPPDITGGLYFIRAMTKYNDGSGDRIVIGHEEFPGGNGLFVRGHDGQWTPLIDTLFVSSSQEINALGTWNDGSGEKLYIAGLFESLIYDGGNIASPGVIGWDGEALVSLGTGVEFWTGEGGRAYGLTKFNDGTGSKLVVSGNVAVPGSASRGVALYDSEGSWSSLTGSDYTVGRFGPYAYSINLNDGAGEQLYLVGNLGTMGTSLGISGIARWNGSTWEGVNWDSLNNGIPLNINVFDPDAAGPLPKRLVALTTQAWMYNGSSWEKMPNWPDTKAITPLNTMTSLDVDGAGPSQPTLYVFSQIQTLSTAAGVPLSHMATYNGSTWAPAFGGVNFGISEDGNPPPEGSLGFGYSMVLHDDGSGPAVYIAGWFTHINGQVARRVAKLVGSNWEEVGGGIDEFTNGGNRVFKLVEFNGDLIALGTFTRAGSATVSNIARWDGTAWNDMAGGLGTAGQNAVAAAVFNDGSGPALFVAGTFSVAGGVPVSNFAKWDGTAWSAAGNFNQSPGTLITYNDGTGTKLYAGGGFTTVNGSAIKALASYDGTTWSALGSGLARGPGLTGSTSVRALQLFNDGTSIKLVVAGQFEIAGGVTVNAIATWDGSSWANFNEGLRISTLGSAAIGERLSAIPDIGGRDRLFASGTFVIAGTRSSNNFAEWRYSNPADFNSSGAVSVQDIFDFLAAWFSGTAAADFNHSGAVTVQDIFDFLAAWFAGCGG